MAEYMVVLRGSDPGLRKQSPGTLQQIMGQYAEWVESLRRRKRYRGGSPFKAGTKRLSGYKDLVMIMDGPSGDEEALTGYFVIEANGLREALEIARTCPALGHGESIEVVELDN